MLFTTANRSLFTMMAQQYKQLPRMVSASSSCSAPFLAKHGGCRTMGSLAHKRFLQKQRMLTPDRGLALAMPTSVREMDNSSLITLAALSDHEACCEMLIRHIMSKDRASYADAVKKFEVIRTHHNQGLSVYLLPYQVGFGAAVTAAMCSVPLVFHLPTVHWFNHHYVTTDIPPPQDLETFLEVGSWAWNWMEPPLGQISFFLLCLQFSRAQLENLGIRPYTRHLKQHRVTKLLDKFPEYDARILKQYSLSCKLWS